MTAAGDELGVGCGVECYSVIGFKLSTKIRVKATHLENRKKMCIILCVNNKCD